MSGLKLLNWKERVSYAAGITMLLTVAPLVACVVAATVLWEAIDRGFRGGLGNCFNRLTEPINTLLVKHKEDAYIVNCVIFYGIGLPAMLAYCGRLHMAAGSFSVLTCFVYHVLRMGPFFMNFAYVYATCHKEGHASAAKAGLWRAPFDKKGPFRHVFNWWIGLFYGVLPSSFAVGHSINHHRYNNGPKDVVSTSDKPRDSAKALVCYLPRFVLYACNVSTIIQFVSDGAYRVALGVAAGSLYWAVFIGTVAHLFGPFFALAYVVYPFLENTLLLACINWSWHAYIDAKKPDNDYMAITILGGTINVLNEDSHVVHHQYPGAHWTKHPHLLLKHTEGYEEELGSVFYGTHTFELFALIIMADYDKLADRFIGYMPPDPDGTLFHIGWHDKNSVDRPMRKISHADAVELLKTRLQTCWWGPRADPAILARSAAGASGEGSRKAAETELAPGWQPEPEVPGAKIKAAEGHVKMGRSNKSPRQATRSPLRRRAAA